MRAVDSRPTLGPLSRRVALYAILILLMVSAESTRRRRHSMSRAASQHSPRLFAQQIDFRYRTISFRVITI